MRVPRLLEIPAIVMATAVLSFTAVSGLQAAVNPPLAKLAAERDGDAFHARSVLGDSGQGTAPAGSGHVHTDLYSLLTSSPESIVPARGQGDSEAAEPNAAVPEAAVPMPATAAPAPVAASGEPVGPTAPKAAVVVPVPAQAAGPSQAAVPVAPRLATAVRTPQPAAPRPAPTPVSGMDYVWDRVFGSGQFLAPASVPKHAPPVSGALGQDPGKVKVCPHGQVAKGTC